MKLCQTLLIKYMDFNVTNLKNDMSQDRVLDSGFFQDTFSFSEVIKLCQTLLIKYKN